MQWGVVGKEEKAFEIIVKERDLDTTRSLLTFATSHRVIRQGSHRDLPILHQLIHEQLGWALQLAPPELFLQVDDDKNTAVHLFARVWGSSDVTTILRRAPLPLPNFLRYNSEGLAPVHCALLNSKTGNLTLRCLLSAGESPDSVTQQKGESALSLAEVCY